VIISANEWKKNSKPIKNSIFILISAEHWGEYWNSGIPFDCRLSTAMFEPWNTGYSEFTKIIPQTIHDSEGIVWYRPHLFLSQFFKFRIRR